MGVIVGKSEYLRKSNYIITDDQIMKRHVNECRDQHDQANPQVNSILGNSFPFHEAIENKYHDDSHFDKVPRQQQEPYQEKCYDGCEKTSQDNPGHFPLFQAKFLDIHEMTDNRLPRGID